MTGIIGAMEAEVQSLCDSLEGRTQIEEGGYVFNKGKLFNKDVVVVKSGIGKVNSALCTQLLILKFGVNQVINTGIAGATGGNLGIFDFVVSSKALYHDFDTTAFGYKPGQVPGMDPEFIADEKLSDSVIKAFSQMDFSKEHKIVKGLVASGDQFISAGEHKDYIKKTFNPLCVEMEGASIAHACTINKVPFVIVRCMSDMADESVKSTYSFNEETCANMCASLVKKIIETL